MCSLKKQLLLLTCPESTDVGQKMSFVHQSKIHSESPTSSATIQEPASVSDGEEDAVGDGCNFSDLYLRNICMFNMKLQGQHLLPVSTIQNIIEEMQNIH